MEKDILEKSQVDLAVDRMERRVLNTFKETKRRYEEGLRDFWQNPEGTPVEIASSYGTRCLKAFQRHGALKDLLVSIKPDVQLLQVSDFGTFQPVLDGDNNPTGEIEILTYKRNGVWYNADGTLVDTPDPISEPDPIVGP